MRRLVAFLVDCTIAGILARIGFLLAESISDRAIFDFPLFWALTGLLLALFEHSHSGITPGRHLTGIKLVSINGTSPTLFSLFVRAEILFLFPYCASLGFEFVFHWLLQQEQFMRLDVVDLGGGFFTLLLFFGPLLLLSRGTQSFHDYIGKTAVVKSNSSIAPHRLSKGIIWSMGTLVVALVTAWYFNFSYENTRMRSALTASPLNREMQSMVKEPQTKKLVISEQDIEPAISELYRYYTGMVATTSVTSAQVELEKLNLIGQTVFHSVENRNEPIIAISALLTFRGITDPAFQEQFAKNACSAVDQRTHIRLCSFEFVYASKLFGPLYAIIRRKLIAFRIGDGSGSAVPIYVSLSPPNGVSYGYGLGAPQEVFMLELSNRNPAQRENAF